jgi:hypothetical protein
MTPGTAVSFLIFENHCLWFIKIKNNTNNNEILHIYVYKCTQRIWQEETL